MINAIVIMNIMLIAIAERTREIGIRKSINTKQRDILTQFLVETTTLNIINATINVALGIGLSQKITAVSPLPTTITP